MAEVTDFHQLHGAIKRTDTEFEVFFILLFERGYTYFLYTK